MMPGIRTPDHAYVPGVTARHAEDAFEDLRGTVRPDMPAADLAETDAFVAGMVFLENGYFWEAHEVLEPVWMALPEGSAERSFVQGLIQLANALLKERMGRPKASLRLCAIARAHVFDARAEVVMGIRASDVLEQIAALEARSEDAK